MNGIYEYTAEESNPKRPLNMLNHVNPGMVRMDMNLSTDLI